jgi:hypothetical protein
MVLTAVGPSSVRFFSKLSASRATPPTRSQAQLSHDHKVPSRHCGHSRAVATPAEAQASLERWSVEVADGRRRWGLTVAQRAADEPLLPLPPVACPAELRAERGVSSSAMVAFEGNRYSVPPAHAGQSVTVLARLGEPTLCIVSAAGVLGATHRRPPGRRRPARQAARAPGVARAGKRDRYQRTQRAVTTAA